MAKTKKRNKRNKRNKNKQEKVNTEPDKIRTCVSSEKLNRSQKNSINLVTPVLIPSPELQIREIRHSGNFRPRSKSTVPIIHSPPSINLSPIAFVTPKSQLIEIDSFLDYKTPVKRIRSNSLICPPTLISQPTKKTKSSPNFTQNKINVSVCTPMIKNHILTPVVKITPIHNSTPKETKPVCEKENDEMCKKISLQSLSPILKNNEIEDSYNKTLNVTPTRRSYGKYKRQKWPMSLFQVFSWFQLAVKKGFAAFKRLIYGIQTEKTSMIEQSFKCNSCKSEIGELKLKLNYLQMELASYKNKVRDQEEKLSKFEEFKKEFEEFKQLNNNKVKCLGAPPPPPPPPLPPPPPQLTLNATPTSRPLKTTMRKFDKGTCVVSRPPITVEDLKKVRLRKTNATTSTVRKAQPINSEEFLSQVKLRPPSRPASPQFSNTSPRSSLARVLKNVDTNILPVRRVKKIQKLNFDTNSRISRSRFGETPNESARGSH